MLQFYKKVTLIIFTLCILAALFFIRENYLKTKFQHKILAELKLVTLKNCKMKRFGQDYDGGYLLCANFLDTAQAAYSYGIDGRDSWGCQVSRELGIRNHQYDCFNTNEPKCEGGHFIFHPECIGPKKESKEGRKFDTLENQIQNSKESGQGIIIKMDVEGAEWDSLLSTSEETLQNIDQLVIEFHSEDNEKEIELLKKLNKHFYLVNLHYNNNACNEKYLPLPSRVYEVLYVNKRIGIVDEKSKKHLNPNPLDMPNKRSVQDCQYSLFY